jgi:RNA polymerase sigma-70 factor (ECF subfamily)
LLALVKSPEMAEDLVHEIFLKLWEIREKLEIKTNFSAYLFRICHNKAADATKKIAGERLLRSELLRYYQDFSTDEQRSQEELYQYDALAEQALDNLSPQSRKVYELCRREGKSYREVAEELHISPYTVKEHMSKALTSLRSFLREKGKIAIILVFLERFL